MATISTIKEAIMLCRAADTSLFIWGHRGNGKSSVVKQLAAERGLGFIDFRCSQLEASDIRGLPDRGADNRTHYLPPADMPIGDMNNKQIAAELASVLGLPSDSDNAAICKAYTDANLQTQHKYLQKLQELQPHFENGLLFLDEVNRAQDDVIQSIFQLVLDKRVGQYVLPPGWSIVAAGNFMSGYLVNGFNDPAFIDRFCHMTLPTGESTFAEWVDYMSKAHGTAAIDTIEFVSHNLKYLDGDVKGDLGFSIQPSRRSWEKFVKVETAYKQGGFSPDAFTEVTAGLVGRDVALAYGRYSCPVKPKELLNRGVDAFKEKLSNLDRNQLTGVAWGLVSFCKDKIDNDDVAKVVLDFAEYMLKVIPDKDVVVGMCRAMVDDSGSKDQRLRAAFISNPTLAKMYSDFGKQSKNKKKSFVDRLVERPALQKLLSQTSWGTR